MSRSLDFIGKEPESGLSPAIHPVQQNGDLSPDEPIYLMASLSSTAKFSIADNKFNRVFDEGALTPLLNLIKPNAKVFHTK